MIPPRARQTRGAEVPSTFLREGRSRLLLAAAGLRWVEVAGGEGYGCRKEKREEELLAAGFFGSLPSLDLTVRTGGGRREEVARCALWEQRGTGTWRATLWQLFTDRWCIRPSDRHRLLKGINIRDDATLGPWRGDFGYKAEHVAISIRRPPNLLATFHLTAPLITSLHTFLHCASPARSAPPSSYHSHSRAPSHPPRAGTTCEAYSQSPRPCCVRRRT